MFLAERLRLARELKNFRQRAGFSTHKLAQVADIFQSKVSRIENAKAAASLAEVEAWAKACGASAEETSQLLELAQRALSEVINARTAIREGLPPIQHNIASLEQSATALKEYQPILIPGLLQTADYARHIFEKGHPQDRPDVPGAIASRIDRQALLYKQDHQFIFLLAEVALRWRIASSEVYMAQIDRIANIATLPNVEIGILPLTQELADWHWHSFILFDERENDMDPLALVETATAAVQVSAAEDINKYREIFTHLYDAAAKDEDSLKLLNKIRAELATEPN